MKNRFISKYHRKLFEKAVKHLDKSNNALMSAIYLLTADQRLWKQIKSHINNNRIMIKTFKPTNCTEIGYTVFCAAKDIYLGTKHIALCDLSDEKLISPTLLFVLCTAIIIRRCGIKIVS